MRTHAPPLEGVRAHLRACVMHEITDEERPHLEALGHDLHQTRRDIGMSRAELARRAELSDGHVWRIETGRRRTRRMTLERIAHSVAEWTEGWLDETEVLEGWLELAGPALAPDLEHPERWGKRKARRQRRRAAIQEEAAKMALEITERALRYHGMQPEVVAAILHPEPPPPPKITAPTPARLRKRPRSSRQTAADPRPSA